MATSFLTIHQKALAIELNDPTQPPSKLVKEAQAKKSPTAPAVGSLTVPSGTPNASNSTQPNTFDPSATTIRVIYTATGKSQKVRVKYKSKCQTKTKIVYKKTNNSARNFIVMDEKILKVGSSISEMKLVKISDTKVLLREGSDKSGNSKEQQKPIIHTVNALPHVGKNPKYYGKAVDVIVNNRPIKLAQNNVQGNLQQPLTNTKPVVNNAQTASENVNKLANLPMNNKPEDNYKSIVGGLQK